MRQSCHEPKSQHGSKSGPCLWSGQPLARPLRWALLRLCRQRRVARQGGDHLSKGAGLLSGTPEASPRLPAHSGQAYGHTLLLTQIAHVDNK